MIEGDPIEGGEGGYGVWVRGRVRGACVCERESARDKESDRDRQCVCERERQRQTVRDRERETEIVRREIALSSREQ